MGKWMDATASSEITDEDTAVPTRTKLPAFQFYVGDHLKDPALSACSASTRGIWMDWVCRMHEGDRCGELQGTAEQLARLGRCSSSEAEAAINELRSTKAADVRVTRRNKSEPPLYVVSNRRMRREFLARKSNAVRQQRFRANTARQPCNGHVAQKSRPYSSSSVINTSSSGSASMNGKAGEWVAVEELLFGLEVAKAAETVETVRLAGCSTTHVRSLIEFWQGKRPAWAQGALVERLKNLRPGQAIDSLWPPSRCSAGPFAAGWQQVSAEEFRAMVQQERFRETPTRHGDDENWVFGILRDGTKVECRNYPPLRNGASV
jgi:hypothetical protein